MTLGTKIVIMKDGVVQQADTPEKVFMRPKNLFVAGFIGSPKMNFIPVRTEKLGCTAMLRFGEARIPLPKEKGAILLSSEWEKKELVMGIRPEHISAVPGDELKEFPPISARKKVVEMRGVNSLLHFDHNGFAMTAQMDSDICRTLEEECRLYINPDRTHIFDAANGIRMA